MSGNIAIRTDQSNKEYAEQQKQHAEQQKQQQKHNENTAEHDYRVGHTGMNEAAGRMVKHLMATASKLHKHMQKKPEVDIGQHTLHQVDAADKLKKWENKEAVLRAAAATAHNAAKIAGLPAAQTTPGGLFTSAKKFVDLHDSGHLNGVRVPIGGRRKRRRTRRRKRRRSRTHTRKRKRSRTRKRKRGGYRKKSRKRRRTRRR